MTDPAYTEETIEKLRQAYLELDLHAYLGPSIDRHPEHGWVWRLDVTEQNGTTGYLHGGIIYVLMDVAASYFLEATLGPAFYSKTIQIQCNLLRPARVGQRLEFRSFLDRTGGGLANFRTETWALAAVDGEDQLLATGSMVKQMQDRRVKPRPNDLDPESFATD